ncbi:MAG: hypothetical protein PHQ43_08720 [Dehalococcoidales bacterium]|nr:hypothetical protein [Dehalococcoidales bacterium]
MGEWFNKNMKRNFPIGRRMGVAEDERRKEGVSHAVTVATEETSQDGVNATDGGNQAEPECNHPLHSGDGPAGSPVHSGNDTRKAGVKRRKRRSDYGKGRGRLGAKTKGA